MAKRRKDSEKERDWREKVARQAASGLSINEFCRRERISVSGFYWWRRELVKRDAANGERGVETVMAGMPAFAEVNVVDDGATPRKSGRDGGGGVDRRARFGRQATGQNGDEANAGMTAIEIVLTDPVRIFVPAGCDWGILRSIIDLTRRPTC